MVTIWDYNTLLTSVNRSSRQKTNKETVVLNDILDQMNLIDIYRIDISSQHRIHILFNCT